MCCAKLLSCRPPIHRFVQPSFSALCLTPVLLAPRPLHLSLYSRACVDAAPEHRIYSAASSHCWWRLDGLWAPGKAAGITSGCRSTTSGSLACVPGCGACAAAPTPAPAPFAPSNASNMNGEYVARHSLLALRRSTGEKVHGQGWVCLLRVYVLRVCLLLDGGCGPGVLHHMLANR